jgi:hypothetical protein
MMECSKRQTTVAATKTLYENFLEENCECDLIIPDYFPAAEKIIQCSAWPIITKKEIEGDRLILEGSCRFSILYQGEDEGGIKAMNESVDFSEVFPLKDVGKEPWVQAVIRSNGNTCRLLNGRKISAKANVAIALKVKDQHQFEIIDSAECENVETLFQPISAYTVLEHPVDTFKVQGEIEVPADIQDVLKTEGVVCVKDIKVTPGKAIVKGILDLYILYTTEEEPCNVEHTSTAIPFTQMLEIEAKDEDVAMDAWISIQNIRTDVEADTQGNNRIISVMATVLAEGEVFADRKHLLLVDAYSNQYPMECSHQKLSTEEMLQRSQWSESMLFEFLLDGEDTEVIQAVGCPTIKRITGKDDRLLIEGVLDVSFFLKEGEQYRSADKSFNFTLEKEVDRLSGQMRCEVQPCLIGTSCSVQGGSVKLKAEMSCMLSVFQRQTVDVIDDFKLDEEHPLETPASSSLVVYFAEKGERLWDIARRYATRVEEIRTVNELKTDFLEEKQLLLICR